MKEKNILGKRLASMLIDHFAMTMIVMLLMLILIGIAAFIGYLSFDDAENLPVWFIVPTVAVGFAIFSVYFNKDAIQGRSPAKRLLKLVVVDTKTNEVASPIKAFLRNITLPLWPVEVIFTFFSPKRRIGDFIAGTKIVEDNASNHGVIDRKKVLLALLLGTLYMLLFVLLEFLVLGYDIFSQLNNQL